MAFCIMAFLYYGIFCIMAFLDYDISVLWHFCIMAFSVLWHFWIMAFLDYGISGLWHFPLRMSGYFLTQNDLVWENFVALKGWFVHQQTQISAYFHTSNSVFEPC
jgi:hypothetical protein